MQVQSTHHSESNITIFLLGAVFNLLTSVDYSSFTECFIKALIGGFVWLIFNLIRDKFNAKDRRKDEK